jgi:hypothetical protein
LWSQKASSDQRNKINVAESPHAVTPAFGRPLGSAARIARAAWRAARASLIESAIATFQVSNDLLTPSYELRALRASSLPAPFDFLTRFHANSPRQILRRPETIFRVSQLGRDTATPSSTRPLQRDGRGGANSVAAAFWGNQGADCKRESHLAWRSLKPALRMQRHFTSWRSNTLPRPKRPSSKSRHPIAKRRPRSRARWAHGMIALGPPCQFSPLRREL